MPLPSSGTGKEGDGINPTVGVRLRGVQPDSKGLVFKKDPSRPGGGIFVAAVDADYSDLPKGVVASAKERQEEEDGEETKMQQQQQQQQSQSQQSQESQMQQPQQQQPSAAASIVNYTPLTSSPSVLPNLNPRMNTTSIANEMQKQVQVMNVLDGVMGVGNNASGASTGGAGETGSSSSQQVHLNPEQLMVENGLVEGMPAGSMFDWDQWDMFFSRFGMIGGGAGNGAGAGNGNGGGDNGNGGGGGGGTLHAFASHAAAQAQAGAATLAGIGRNRPAGIVGPQQSSDQRGLSLDPSKVK